MKRIMIKFNLLLLILFGFVSALNAQTDTSINAITTFYATDNDKNIPASVTSNIFANATKSSNASFDTLSNRPICGEIYKVYLDKDKKEIKREHIKTEKTLIDFSFTLGTFRCLYSNETEFGTDKKEIVNYKLVGYAESLTAIEQMTPRQPIPFDSIYTLFKGDYKPSNLEKFESFDGSGSYSVYKRAKELGLYVKLLGEEDVASGNSNLDNIINKNFTVSQFITGLITLNTDVVLGVEPNGDVKINPDVKARMAILNEDMNVVEKVSLASKQVWNSLLNAVPFVDTGISSSEIKSNDFANKLYSTANTFISYFNLKVYGLYYNFMNIAWGSVFSYASFGVLSMMMVYTSSIVGYRFFAHKLDKQNEGKPFEFPIANRLVAIGATMALSFIQYPVGTGTKVDLGSSIEEYYAKTSIVKNVIGFASNIGGTVADVSIGAVMPVYLDFLRKSSNTQSYEDITKSIAYHKRSIVEQTIVESFFKDHCVLPFKTRFEALGNFQSAETLENSSIWRSVNSDWIQNKQSIFFDTSKKTENDLVSANLCSKIETSLVLNREYLKKMKAEIETNIRNLSLNFSDIMLSGNNLADTTRSQLFIDTQLEATKKLGWISTATIPVIHLFMANSNIIDNVTGSRTTDNVTGLNRTSTMLLDKTKSTYKSEGNQLGVTAIENGEGNSDFLTKILTKSLSVQVYMMLPAFESVRKGIQEMLTSAYDLLTDLIVKFATNSHPLIKTVKNVIDFGSFIVQDSNSDDLKKVDKDGKNVKKINYSLNGIGALVIYVTSLFIAVFIYEMLISAIFATVITLLAVLKITLYFWDVFAHYFVSPFIVGWKLTVNERTDKINGYIVDGLILYVIKPTLIVFSFSMFIISYEILNSVYGLIFDLVFSSMELADALYDESDFMSTFIMSSVKGTGQVFIYIIGMVLSYFIILKGDTMILEKLKYKDETDTGVANQLGDRVQTLAGGRI